MKSDISMLDMTDRERTAFYMDYEWTRKDGKVVELLVKIREPERG